ncbi:MAG TPA: NADAR domain-containing protein, partial [Bryobacteraceae bacterium]|nr:NADAR domain-containing protein [Bryobacteraceae bacterium]
MSAVPTPSKTRAYRPEECIVFRRTNEDFGGLSNMAPGFPLEVNGVRIRSSEALYQACRFPDRPEIQRLIIQQTSPMTAKMKSKPYRESTRGDWDAVRVNVMRWCLRVKLAENWSTFKDLLLATGDRSIVEESRKDDFWGAKKADDGTLVGRNVLGRLLMELRQEIKGPNPEFLQRVEPLDIPQFLLFGKVIGSVRQDNSPHVSRVAKAPVSRNEESTAAPPERGNQVEPSVGNPINTKQESRGSWVIPRECKRLAEVDFPIAEVSKHSAREKSIRHGHPSTLHLWWARRPMAACRAMLMALLLPDPCDETCPDEFKIAARKALGHTWHKLGPEDGDLRAALLKFIADFAAWERSADPTYLETARGLVKAAYPEEAPTVVDSFAGGGTIPSEALRLGCEAFANDLNPIAGLICKVLLEDVPRHGSPLIDALKREVAALNTFLKAQLSAFYPARISGEEPTAYLWARVVRCEAPRCGAAIPLLRSLWLSKGDSSRSALRVTVERPSGKSPDVILSVYEPSPDEQVGAGTVSGGRAVCPACTIPLLRPAVESQLRVQRGGTDSARLVAVMVATPEGRKFRTPATSDHKALHQVRERDVLSREAEYAEGIPVYPNEPLNPVRPSPNARGLSAVTRYGMATFSDCYLPRQRVVLSEFVSFVRNYDCSDPGLDGAVGRCLLIILGRCVDRWSSCSRLDSSRDTVTGSFSKQALQLVWDFCEANPFSEWSGGLANAVEWVEKALERAMISFVHPGQVRLGDARALPLPDQSVGVWFTDPPYYDSVPYADLADFFFCWLKRANPAMGDRRDPLDQSNTLTPKREECVWNQSHFVDGKPKDASFFEGCVSNAFDEGKRVLDANGIGCVVFAHKSTEGWEALLNGLLSAGLCITCSWPVQTEMKSRTAARNAASLMGSVHLVCRPRPEEAPVGEWGE